MRVIGIDPGIWEFAWVLYCESDNAIVDHGYTVLSKDRLAFPPHDAICIEDVVALWQRSRNMVECAKTIGFLLAKYPSATLIPRKTIVSVLTGSARSGDAEVALALSRLVTNTPPKFTRGFTGHHRAALAIAYVGVGRIKAREALALA